MKNQTEKTGDAPIKKVQLNTRVPEALNHEGGKRSVLEDQTLKEISRTIAVALIVAVWLALAILLGLIGSAVIGCQWVADRLRK
jgi:hypothetical protein